MHYFLWLKTWCLLSVQVLLLQTLFILCLFLVSLSGITIVHGLCVCDHIYSMKKIVCFTCCVCQYWGCGGKGLTPHALNVAHHLAVG